MKHPVPRNWASDKALAVIEGLQSYVDAIWDEYGDELIELLAEQWGAPPEVDDDQLDLPF